MHRFVQVNEFDSVCALNFELGSNYMIEVCLKLFDCAGFSLHLFYSDQFCQSAVQSPYFLLYFWFFINFYFSFLFPNEDASCGLHDWFFNRVEGHHLFRLQES